MPAKTADGLKRSLKKRLLNNEYASDTALAKCMGLDSAHLSASAKDWAADNLSANQLSTLLKKAKAQGAQEASEAAGELAKKLGAIRKRR